MTLKARLSHENQGNSGVARLRDPLGPLDAAADPTCHLGARAGGPDRSGHRPRPPPRPRTPAAGAPGRRHCAAGHPRPRTPHPAPAPAAETSDEDPQRTRGAHAARGRPSRGVRPTLAPGTPRHKSLGLGPQNLLSSYRQDRNFSKAATELRPATHPNGLREPPGTVKISRQTDPNLAAESWELKGWCGRRKGRAQASSGAGMWAGRGAGQLRGSWRKGRVAPSTDA